MPDRSEFDPYTPISGRTLEEMWLPFADPHERQMRDATVGADESIYDLSLNLFRLNRNITHKQIGNVYDAILFANILGSVLNVGITLTWKYANIIQVPRIEYNFQKFTDRLRKFLEYHGCDPRYYAVFENGPDEGYHTHFAAHIPDRIRPEFKKWRLRAAQDWAISPRVASRFLHTHMHRDDNVVAQWNLFKYLMKGLDPKLTNFQKRVMPEARTANYYYGVQKQDMGELLLSRVRIARSLGPLARSKHPYYYKPHAIDDVPFCDRYSDRIFRGREMAMVRRALKLI